MLAATNLTPRIVRNVIKAAHSSQPIGERQHRLDEAIRHARALLDELELQRLRLGWRDRGDDAA
jgi:hypothetical protein